jgi:predicted MPP superfamily phosphohydrolase
MIYASIWYKYYRISLYTQGGILKVQPISDLHLDCLEGEKWDGVLHSIINPEADVIVFAGDMCEYRNIRLLKRALADVHQRIIYVPGNHEYWGSNNFKGLVKDLKTEFSDMKNVSILNEDYRQIDGVIFIGGTLWTNLWNPINANIVQHYMADFRQCPGLTTDWTNMQHESMTKFIEECLRVDTFKELKKIVVTHHGPSFRAVAKEYRFSHANCGYFSALDHILESERSPDIWIHGHSHIAMDEKIGNTRVIRNPFGYQGYGEKDTGFNKEFLIDTSTLTREVSESVIEDMIAEFESKFL